MTKKDLAKVYYLEQDKKRCEEMIAELIESLGAKAKPITGMPFSQTNNVSDPTSDIAIRIQDQIEELQQQIRRVTVLKAEIEMWLNTLDDELLKVIIHWRCVKLKSWEVVAIKVGGDNTADSVRMYYNRHVPNE